MTIGGPASIAEPLAPHALSHVMSEVLSNYAPTDEDEIRIDLQGAGYRPNEVEQVMRAWADYWERVPQCSTCCQPATHLWGSVGEDGVISSMAGPYVLSPSCDNCCGERYDDGAERPVVRAPLSFDRRLPMPKPLAIIQDLLDEDYAGRAADQEDLDEEIARPLDRRVARLLRDYQALESKLHAVRRSVREALS